MMQNDSPEPDDQKPASRAPQARSRLTNGSQLLPDIDGRSLWARRMRDLIELHVDDLGGVENTSEAERSIVRRVAVIEVEMEYAETRLAELRQAGKAPTDGMLELYCRMAGHLRRLLESVGLQRRSRDVTPGISELLNRGRRGS